MFSFRVPKEDYAVICLSAMESQLYSSWEEFGLPEITVRATIVQIIKTFPFVAPNKSLLPAEQILSPLDLHMRVIFEKMFYQFLTLFNSAYF